MFMKIVNLNFLKSKDLNDSSPYPFYLPLIYSSKKYPSPGLPVVRLSLRETYDKISARNSSVMQGMIKTGSQRIRYPGVISDSVVVSLDVNAVINRVGFSGAYAVTGT